MRREDILNNFENATDVQIKALLDINSADIGNALGKQKSQLDKVLEDLATANNRVKELEAASGDAEALRKKIAEYEEADKKRKEEEEAAAALAELTERFDAAAGDRTFLHDMVRKGVMNDFGEALKDKAYRGKSDAEIFEALTKDKDYFKPMNPPMNMGKVNPNIGGGELDKLDDAAYYAKVFADKQK